MGRNALSQRVVGQVAGLGVPGDQRQRVDHRPVGRVAAAELQHFQERDQSAPVMLGVGSLQRGLHRAPIQRALRLELMNQLSQRLLPAGNTTSRTASSGLAKAARRDRLPDRLLRHMAMAPWRWLLLLCPTAMATALVYFAEHYVIDAVAGALVAGAVLVGCNAWEGRRCAKPSP